MAAPPLALGSRVALVVATSGRTLAPTLAAHALSGGQRPSVPERLSHAASSAGAMAKANGARNKTFL